MKQKRPQWIPKVLFSKEENSFLLKIEKPSQDGGIIKGGSMSFFCVFMFSISLF